MTMITTTWSEGDLSWSYTQLDELDDIAAMLAKDSVCEHMFFGPNTPAQTHSYFMPMLGPMRIALSGGLLPDTHLFTIRHIQPPDAPGGRGAFVGQCALVPVPFGDGNFTVGYQLDEPWWGKGYGGRTGLFLVWYGFAVLGAHRLSGDCLASNLASARILEKCGFQREGVQKAYYRAGGRLADNLLFGLLRDDLSLDLTELGARFQAPTDGRRPRVSP